MFNTVSLFQTFGIHELTFYRIQIQRYKNIIRTSSRTYSHVLMIPTRDYIILNLVKTYIGRVDYYNFKISINLI